MPWKVLIGTVNYAYFRLNCEKTELKRMFLSVFLSVCRPNYATVWLHVGPRGFVARMRSGLLGTRREVLRSPTPTREARAGDPGALRMTKAKVSRPRHELAASREIMIMISWWGG